MTTTIRKHISMGIVKLFCLKTPFSLFKNWRVFVVCNYECVFTKAFHTGIYILCCGHIPQVTVSLFFIPAMFLIISSILHTVTFPLPCHI